MKTDLFNAVIDYDRAFDQLSIRRGGMKTSFSLEIGNLTFDFTRKEFVGIDVQDAAAWLQDIFGTKVNPAQISSAKIGFEDRHNLVRLALLLGLKNERKLEKELLIQKAEPMKIPA